MILIALLRQNTLLNPMFTDNFLSVRAYYLLIKLIKEYLLRDFANFTNPVKSRVKILVKKWGVTLWEFWVTLWEFWVTLWEFYSQFHANLSTVYQPLFCRSTLCSRSLWKSLARSLSALQYQYVPKRNRKTRRSKALNDLPLAHGFKKRKGLRLSRLIFQPLYSQRAIYPLACRGRTAWTK